MKTNLVVALLVTAVQAAKDSAVQENLFKVVHDGEPVYHHMPAYISYPYATHVPHTTKAEPLP